MTPKRKPKADWRTRAYAAAEGRLMGAIIRAVAFSPGDFVADDEVPRFVGRASITSDGFIMCDFISRDGTYHHGALVGTVDDLTSNAKKLAGHVHMDARERTELYDAIRRWIVMDWRDDKTITFE